MAVFLYQSNSIRSTLCH